MRKYFKVWKIVFEWKKTNVKKLYWKGVGNKMVSRDCFVSIKKGSNKSCATFINIIFIHPLIILNKDIFLSSTFFGKNKGHRLRASCCCCWMYTCYRTSPLKLFLTWSYFWQSGVNAIKCTIELSISLKIKMKSF